MPVPRLPWWQGTDGYIDFSRFNLTLWRNLDRALRALAERSMILIPFSIFGGTNGMPRIPAKREWDLFLRYWVARWGGYWSATFQPTSEWEEGFTEQEIQYIGNRLLDLDGGRHLISVHSLRASSESVQNARWYRYHTVQDKLDCRDFMKYTWFVQLFCRVPKPILAHNVFGRETSISAKQAWISTTCVGRDGLFCTLRRTNQLR